MTAARRVRLGGFPGRPVTPPGAVRIDRGTALGNPFPVGARLTRHEALAWFRRFAAGEPAAVELAREVGWRSWRRNGPALCDLIRERVGPAGVVACWCGLGEDCHGDLVLHLAAGGQP
jgi:hypothetical protein